MTMPPRYMEFGYPLDELPLPGHAVTSLDVVNTVEPLLAGTLAIIMALNNAFVGHTLTTEAASNVLSLLEGHLETALHIMKRWQHTERINTCGSEPDDAPGGAGDDN